MNKPDFLDEMINKAAYKAGSDYKLAQYLGVNRAEVSQWRSGKRPCHAGEIALMADYLGMDAEAWANRATVAQYAGTAKGERLAIVLGKALLATGAVLAGSGASAATVTAKGLAYLIRCIVLLSKKQPLAHAF